MGEVQGGDADPRPALLSSDSPTTSTAGNKPWPRRSAALDRHTAKVAAIGTGYSGSMSTQVSDPVRLEFRAPRINDKLSARSDVDVLQCPKETALWSLSEVVMSVQAKALGSLVTIQSKRRPLRGRVGWVVL